MQHTEIHNIENRNKYNSFNKNHFPRLVIYLIPMFINSKAISILSANLNVGSTHRDT